MEEDRFRMIECSCGYRCYTLHDITDCPVCGSSNIGVRKEDDPDWFERSVVPEGDKT